MKSGISINIDKYSSYKESGVDWLGSVPEHWDLTRLGTRFEERRTKVSDKDFAPLSVTKNGVLPQLDSAAKTNDGDNRKLVKAGDFVINSRSDRKGSSGIALTDGSVSLINIVLRPLGIDPTFCNYLLKSNSFIEEFYRMGHGIVADLWTTRYDEMKAIMVGLPPLNEQSAIANFLDKKTALIDKAIAIKEKQIELLKERRQILIHRAVTRGLNPNVKMKDSGVEWIGEVPEHWELKRVRFLFDYIRTGTTPSTLIETYYNENINWFNPKDLDFEILGESERKISNLAIERGEAKLFKGDSILIVGIGATSGKTSYMPHCGSFNQQITGFHSDVNHNKYYFYLFKTLSNVFLGVANYTTLPILNNAFFKDFILVLPQYEEQKMIVNELENKSILIEQAIDLKVKEVELLKEYKSSLINSLITGKIKGY